MKFKLLLIVLLSIAITIGAIQKQDPMQTVYAICVNEFSFSDEYNGVRCSFSNEGYTACPYAIYYRNRERLLLAPVQKRHSKDDFKLSDFDLIEEEIILMEEECLDL